MAILQNNVQNVKFLRNQDVNITRDAAISLLNTHKEDAADGTALLARYTVSGTVKTIVGFVYVTGSTHDITIFDTEGTSGDVEKLRQEINAKLGEGITSDNTATEQLAALSGDTFVPGTSSSADTSVEGAKAYAYDLVGTLDGGVTAATGSYVASVTEVDGKISGTTEALPTVAAISSAGKAITAVSESNGAISATAGTIDAQYVTASGFTATDVQGALKELENGYKTAISGLDYSDAAVAGEYVSQVTEEDGIISVTRVALPSSADTAQAMKLVTAVAEDKGQISVSRGEITSSNKTISLSANTDGGIDFKANVDGTTIIVDEETGTMSVASSALVQYEGDDDTIQISAVSEGVRTVSSPLTIQKVTSGLDADVREAYRLVGHSGNTIGDLVKIYKDSSLLSVALLHADTTANPQVLPTYNKETDTWTDISTPTEANQALCFAYENVSGATVVAAVPVGAFINEQEFASGITWDSAAGKVKGVVDSTSETFLTVGADGFKLAGVQDAINTAVSGLDADVSGTTEHIKVNVVETDGVITTVTVEEDNIANANDLAALSGKTITAITSTNGSITASISNEAGNKTADIQTDADKIKMSGFSADTASSLSGISESDSIATAFEKTNTVITENERVTAAALTNLDGRLDVIESGYVETVKVNDVALAETNNAVNVQISGATSAVTATTTEAIVVNTDANGAITLGLANIDCGYYS